MLNNNLRCYPQKLFLVLCQKVILFKLLEVAFWSVICEMYPSWMISYLSNKQHSCPKVEVSVSVLGNVTFLYITFIQVKSLSDIKNIYFKEWPDQEGSRIYNIYNNSFVRYWIDSTLGTIKEHFFIIHKTSLYSLFTEAYLHSQ